MFVNTAKLGLEASNINKEITLFKELISLQNTKIEILPR
jgi:hypothetical protein